MKNTTAAGLPSGWLATAVGGTLGTIGGGIFGVALSSAYVDTYQPNSGFEGLGTVIVGAALMALIGAVFGAAGALKLRRCNRPVASGVTFTVAGAAILLLLGSVGQLVVPAELHDDIGAVLLFTLSPILAGITSRSIFTNR